MRTYLAAYRVKTLLGMVGKGFEVVFELMVPVVVARMIDEGVAGHNASVVVRYGILLAANMVFTAVFVDRFDSWWDAYVQGKIFSTAITTLWNYFIMKHWVFPRREEEGGRR